LDRTLSNAAIRARVQGLKCEVDELLRLLGDGALEGSKMICCHKCGVGMPEYPARELQSNLVHSKDKQVLIEPIKENLVQYEGECSGDEKYSGNEIHQGVELSSKGGEQRTKSMDVITSLNETLEKSDAGVIEGDMIIAAEGVGLMEKETGTVMAEEFSLAPTQEQMVTGPNTMIVNTYNRRHQKSLNENESGNEKAIVVWENSAKLGIKDKGAVRVEEGEGQLFEPIGCCYAGEIVKGSILDIRPPASNWVLHKIQEFSKMVGVSCSGYENELMHLFEELETRRGHEMYSPGGRARRRGDRELKRLECSINYDVKSGVSKKGVLGRDEGEFR
jgi:hypothetical protein